jgi:CBS domain-containing protein
VIGLAWHAARNLAREARRAPRVMGTKHVRGQRGSSARVEGARALLDDIVALERMLAAGMFDDGPARIGAEQEMLLLRPSLCPAPAVASILRTLADARFTSELAVFNLEANLTPRHLAGRSLAALESELAELCAAARGAARNVEADVLLCGYLPTYEPCLANLAQMVAEPRFAAVNRGALEPRGGTLQIKIHGRDVLELAHDNIMLEGAATSFQVHYQVAPAAFAAVYNAALLTAAPVLAVCANSPLAFGHRLWDETRVPLLELSGDLRPTGKLRRPGSSRTAFGEGWVERSPLELFQRDLCRFEPMFEVSDGERSTVALAAGRTPRLRALTTFNGTVWRWLRPCYGVTDGRPHLRVENRFLPAGPTIVDEVANAALWIGLLCAMPAELGGAAPPLEFRSAEENFHAAARSGLEARLSWLDGERVTAHELLADRLVPMARKGLARSGVHDADIRKYLGIIERRLARGRTGARWMLDSFDALPKRLSPRERSWRVTAALVELCWSGLPVHDWPSRPAAAAPRSAPPLSVALRTDFIAVPPEQPVILAEKQLAWSRTSHLVVETAGGELIAVISAADIRRRRLALGKAGNALSIGEVAAAVPAAPELATHLGVNRAIEVLEAAGQKCGVVLHGRRLAGIVLLADLEEIFTPSCSRASGARATCRRPTRRWSRPPAARSRRGKRRSGSSPNRKWPFSRQRTRARARAPVGRT